MHTDIWYADLCRCESALLVLHLTSLLRYTARVCLECIAENCCTLELWSFMPLYGQCILSCCLIGLLGNLLFNFCFRIADVLLEVQACTSYIGH